MECNSAPALTVYLGGRMRKQALPQFNGSPGPGAPPLKRLLLPQGELAQLLDAEQSIRYLAFVELREGTVRGNHFHKVKQEFIYLIQGQALLLVEDTQSKAQDRVPMEPGELVFIPTGVAHRLEVLKAGQAVEFSETRFDPGDIYPYQPNSSNSSSSST
jgi:mannose-6-phosphate isomerase-like protein (cupin superfamily)